MSLLLSEDLERAEEAEAVAERALELAAIAFTNSFEGEPPDDPDTHYDYVIPFPELEALLAAAREYAKAWNECDTAQVM